jgi:diaminopimelate decarboxylase
VRTMKAVQASDFGDIHALAAKYETPLVIYSSSQLAANCQALQGALPGRASLAYSVKANPNPAIATFLHGRGCWAEVASAGELTLALRSGIDPRLILLGGPAKSEAAIKLGLAAGIRAFVVESRTELGRVAALARQGGIMPDVALRVNPMGLRSRSALRMVGAGTQFGIAEAEIPDAIRACDASGVRYAGLLMYAGTQHFDALDIIENTRYLCRFTAKLIQLGAPPPRLLDFGGGFGVPETREQKPLELEVLAGGLRDIMATEIPSIGSALEDVIFESGRYLAATAGVLVVRVLDVKRLDGRSYAVVDGGLNSVGVYQRSYRSIPPMLEKVDSGPVTATRTYTVVGPTCTPLDVLHESCELPELAPGDLLVLRNGGAYTSSYSAIHFCGHPWLAEVMIGLDGNDVLVRRRGTFEEACGIGYQPASVLTAAAA